MGISSQSSAALLRRAPLALLASLAACGAMPKLPTNPTPLHADLKIPVPGVAAQGSEINTFTLPLDRYLQAFAEADRAGKVVTPEQLQSYANAGIAVVQVQCLRWFNTLATSQLSKDFQDANYNVIRQLGTALLGVGKAAPAFVAVYGAGNTAYEGISNNLESSFLGAPNGKKVKQKIMQLLDDQEKDLSAEAAKTGATVLGIYKRLERYADICTHTMAREIVSTSLDQAKVSISLDGNLEVGPTPGAKELAAARESNQSAAKTQKIKEDELIERAAIAERARNAAIAAAQAAEARAKGLADQLQELKNSLPKPQPAVQPATPASSSSAPG